eukprot:4983943-Karenia_brevis.AAC.1
MPSGHGFMASSSYLCHQIQCSHLSLREGWAAAACGTWGLSLDVISFAAISARRAVAACGQNYPGVANWLTIPCFIILILVYGNCDDDDDDDDDDD